MLNTTRKDHVVGLLQKLKNTAVPKSLDSGEAITYLALKDTILDNAITILDASETIEAAKPATELCVDHQKLANAVLERTFDAHAQLLRQRLKEAEEEAEMWRKVTLFGRHRTLQSASTDMTAVMAAAREQHRSDGTQTPAEGFVPSTTSKASSPLAANEVEVMKHWLDNQAEATMTLLDKKLELFCQSSIVPSLENKSPLENKKGKPSTDADTEPDNYNRSLPDRPVANPCPPLGKPPSKTKQKRKMVTNPIVPFKPSSVKSPAGAQRAAALPPGKPAESGAFARQESALSSPTAPGCEDDNFSEPLYVLHTLHLAPRNSVSPSSTAHFSRNDKRGRQSQLPRL